MGKQLINLDLKGMSSKERFFFLVTLIKMCSWLTSYIAFVNDITMNTFIMLDSIQFQGIKRIH